MSQLHKLLGRSNPAAATPTTLYTAPSSTTTLVSSLHICNTDVNNSDSVQIMFVPSGGSAGVSNAIIFNLVIPPGNPFIMNTVPVLMTGDFISVRSANGTTCFTASGVEIT